MKRKKIIKLLSDIEAGRKTIGELLPPIFRVWVQDCADPNIFHYKPEGLTRRKDESLPGTGSGQRFIDVWEYSANCPPILESETEISTLSTSRNTLNGFKSLTTNSSSTNTGSFCPEK